MTKNINLLLELDEGDALLAAAVAAEWLIFLVALPPLTIKNKFKKSLSQHGNKNIH